MTERARGFTEEQLRNGYYREEREVRERIHDRDGQRENSSANPSLEEIAMGGFRFTPEKKGFPCFVKLKSDGEKVRVITFIFGSGFFDFLVLKRNGEMFQIGITECIALEDYVDYMFDQQDILVDQEYNIGGTLL